MRVSPSLLELRSGESAIFGYGSLLWQPSMERTLGRPYEGTPVVAHLPGWRRVWDVAMANETFYFEKSDATRCQPARIAYLNIRRGDAAVNGLLYAVSQAELAAFDQREEPYDRVDVTDAIEGAAVRGGRTYVYVGKPARLVIWPQEREQVAIRATYLDIIENGLRALGEGFRADYLRSTDPPPPASVIADRRVERP